MPLSLTSTQPHMQKRRYVPCSYYRSTGKNDRLTPPLSWTTCVFVLI